ncbi:MAG: FAD-binding protein, partial [Bacteroidota bacterium]
MSKIIELKLLPEEAMNEQVIAERTARKLRLPVEGNWSHKVLRRSIDARGKQAFFRLRVEVWDKEPPPAEPALLDQLQDVSEKAEVIVVGAGPAGYFAALELIELGFKPVLFDRGKDVRSRRRDLRAIQQFGEVNPHSNYCFGEGGAGTYSDGKLYTRSHKRGSIAKALQLLVEHGAQTDILIDAHPHIGSNKLPKVVANIRETILHHGGEIHFDSLVTDLLVREGKMVGVVINEKEEHLA